LAFWGKTRGFDGELVSYPLVAHSLDVAAVAQCLPRLAAPLDPAWIGFLVSVHDIGKFSRAFQGQVKKLWPAGVLGDYDARRPPRGPRHDGLTLRLLAEAEEDGVFDDLLPGALGGGGWRPDQRLTLFRPIAGHHGRPVEQPDYVSEALCSGSRTAARDFIQLMRALFQPPPLPPMSKASLRQLEWRLAGFLTLADWIGSREEWFPLADLKDVSDPSAYLTTLALPRARAAVAQARVLPAGVRAFAGLSALFPAVEKPSPLQTWAEAVPLPEGPVLAVLEDMTGSGKTEAALVLAHRLMAAGRGRGLFLALPTMATANGIFARLHGAYRGLFAEGEVPSIALTHGKAEFNLLFRAAIAVGVESKADTESPAQPASSEAECAAWLAEDRRRALLADCGVGTIDQALLAILPVRQAPLRLHGLSNKILIIDEAHAFDRYMRREMQALLHFHAALGGSAILLSATLPRTVRQSLVDAFRQGLGTAPLAVRDDRYPLATLAAAETVEEQPLAPRLGVARAVQVTQARSQGDVVERVLAAAQSGAAVAWIRNSVDDALDAAEALRAAGVDPLVFHARFVLADRLAIEERVRQCFGRDSAGAERDRVLVATQVVEQSLDLDFDLICTDIAPADSLIQRAGRLWRHQRGPRPISGPEMVVLSPDPVAEADASWLRGLLPRTDSVYRDPALLWRSARAVFACSHLTTPDDMRALIEAAAGVATTPAGLVQAAGKAEGKGAAISGIAAQNVLSFEAGYTPQSGAWEPETQTPTRLEDRPQVTLRLGMVENGLVRPYAKAETLAEAWSLSEVTVAQHRVSACPIPDGLAAAAAVARASWGRWERDSPRVLLALLQHNNDDTARYRLDGTDGKEQPVKAFYSELRGLAWR
jgi:CRISPR-associated endonuclease/helicase Cas3